MDVYISLKAKNLEILDNKVNELMAKGYVPHLGQNINKDFFTQAMVHRSFLAETERYLRFKKNRNHVQLNSSETELEKVIKEIGKIK